MDLANTLIESKPGHRRRNWRSVSASIVAHVLVIASLLWVSLHASQKVAAENHAIPVFTTRAAAPPPPPPKGGEHSEPKPKPTVAPKVIPQQSFVAPREIPRELPTPVTLPSAAVDATSGVDTPDDSGPIDGGVTGGVNGGVAGGTVGGVVGGEVGGTVGGTSDGTAAVAMPQPPPPSPPPVASTAPLRVGGDVKAPVTIRRTDPQYTEAARHAHVTGVVILEAVIDRSGNVDRVKIVRGLPMGLGEEAVAAVRRWKFKPGTLNGQPVDVIFNLTVVFQLGADVPHEKNRVAKPGAAAQVPAPQAQSEPVPSQPPAPEPPPPEEQPAAPTPP